MPARLFIVAYDICHPRRLRRVHKIVRDYGIPVQYSVFSCRLRPIDRAELEAKLREVVNTNEDQVLLVPLHRTCESGELLPGSITIGLSVARGHTGALVL